VSEKSHRVVYYTNPAKVKQKYSPEEIIAHYRYMLSEKGPAPWVWVFDGTGFDTDHIMELKTGEGIAELLETFHMTTLQDINIINPSVHLKVLWKVIRPFMSDALKAKVRILDDRPRSVLEFM
jgi:uncharacterized protein (DUF433 family)